VLRPAVNRGPRYSPATVFTPDSGTTVLAIPNYRLEPKDKTAFSYWETPTGNPSALRAWFYPGDNFGQEFVYPKGLAAKIAREAGATVLATPAESEAELRTAPLTEIDKAGAEQPVVEEALAAPVPRPSPVAAAPATEPVPTPAPQAPEPAAPPALPATASPYFTVGLVGLLVLGTGAFLRLARSRVTSR
jgi:hypothetical protein